jgi:hypothetical protein
MIGNYDARFGSIPITDEMIEAATPFEGWQPEFLKWDESLWYLPSTNAYHIKYLAEIMLKAGGWVGPPIEVKSNCRLRDGSHRLRATQYLLRQHGHSIRLPVAGRIPGDFAP